MNVLAVALSDWTGSEGDMDRAVADLTALSPDPDILDYIFHSDMGPQAAVDKALRNKPKML